MRGHLFYNQGLSIWFLFCLSDFISFILFDYLLLSLVNVDASL